jgi:hypothetical protein
VPLAIKIAPDLTDDALRGIARVLVAQKMDAVIATNTTLARDAVEGLPHAEETGGLSGAPLFERSTAVVRVLAGCARRGRAHYRRRRHRHGRARRGEDRGRRRAGADLHGPHLSRPEIGRRIGTSY